MDGVGDVTSGEGGIGEGACEFGGGEGAVVDLDGRGFAEVGGQEVGAVGVGGEGDVGVDGAGGAVVNDDLGHGVGGPVVPSLLFQPVMMPSSEAKRKLALVLLGQEVAGGGAGGGDDSGG